MMQHSKCTFTSCFTTFHICNTIYPHLHPPHIVGIVGAVFVYKQILCHIDELSRAVDSNFNKLYWWQLVLIDNLELGLIQLVNNALSGP